MISREVRVRMNESTGDVSLLIEITNLFDTSEYDVFCRAYNARFGNSKSEGEKKKIVDAAFNAYFARGVQKAEKIPFWVRDFIRKQASKRRYA